MKRDYYEQVILQEEEQAELLAAQTANSIEHAIRVCGLNMLNKALTGMTVSVNP